MSRTITYADLDRFMKKLEKDDYLSRLNYFRWMEYPLTLSMMKAEKGMKVLEVGAGLISLPPLYLAAASGCKVTAIDKREYDEQSRHFIEQTRQRLDIPEENLSVLSMDAGDLEFEDESFDLVSAISVLEHLPVFTDSKVMKELGRVVKQGGRLILSVPFNLGHHIETESWGGDEYEQRHYNDYTVRQRLVNPTQMHFVQAVAFGEIDPAVGKKFVKMPDEEKQRFCLKNHKKINKFWQEYYRIKGENEFIVHKPKLSDDVLEKAGVIAIELIKEEKPPKRSYFEFIPLDSYLENQKLCKTPENTENSVTIEKIEFLNTFESELNVFESGEAMRIRVHMKAHGTVTNPCFFIHVQDKFDNIIYGVDSYLAGFDMGIIYGKHKLDIDFGMLNLLPGEYKISISLWEYDSPNPVPPYPYDVKHQYARIIVRERIPGAFGAVYMPFSLKVEKEGVKHNLALSDDD